MHCVPDHSSTLYENQLVRAACSNLFTLTLREKALVTTAWLLNIDDTFQNLARLSRLME